MFKSFNSMNGAFNIIDDDFECSIDKADDWTYNNIAFYIIKVYSEKKLEVGKNLALAIIDHCKKNNCATNGLIQWQDQNCHKFVNNWSKIAKERNYWLKKFLIWA